MIQLFSTFVTNSWFWVMIRVNEWKFKYVTIILNSQNHFKVCHYRGDNHWNYLKPNYL